METARFVLLSDVHLSRDGGDDAWLFSDTLANLDYALGWIRALPTPPDFVVVSGDLTNHGHEESFDVLSERMASLGVPVVYALGNHDERGPFYERVLGEPERGSAPYDHDQVLAGVHVVALDSSTPGTHVGSLEDEQLDWLAATLARHPELPKLVVVHHPPAPLPHPAFDFLNLRAGDADRLADVLEGANVLGVLSGHVHHDQFMVWRGLPCIVSAGLHNVTDVGTEDALRAVRGGAFGLGSVVDGALRYVSIPIPGDLSELHRIDLAAMRAHFEPHAQASESA